MKIYTQQLYIVVLFIITLHAQLMCMQKALPELPIAAKRNMVPELLQLLQSGIDVNVKTPDEYTALHWAANNGHIKVVNLLNGQG